MKQGTMNILFFVLKTKLLKNGEAPVLMRITINGDYWKSHSTLPLLATQNYPFWLKYD